MLKLVKSWVNGHIGMSIDSRAKANCAFDLGVNPNEAMFSACWNMASNDSSSGVDFGHITVNQVDCVVHVLPWHNRNSHVIAYHQTIGVQRRMFSAVRHDLGRDALLRFL